MLGFRKVPVDRQDNTAKYSSGQKRENEKGWEKRTSAAEKTENSVEG